MQGFLERQRLTHARRPWRSPMPWFNRGDMSGADLMAIFRYSRQLGAESRMAPAHLPPIRRLSGLMCSFPRLSSERLAGEGLSTGSLAAA